MQKNTSTHTKLDLKQVPPHAGLSYTGSSKGSLNDVFTVVSILINYLDKSTFCWCGMKINEEREKMKKPFLQ